MERIQKDVRERGRESVTHKPESMAGVARKTSTFAKQLYHRNTAILNEFKQFVSNHNVGVLDDGEVAGAREVYTVLSGGGLSISACLELMELAQLWTDRAQDSVAAHRLAVQVLIQTLKQKVITSVPHLETVVEIEESPNVDLIMQMLILINTRGTTLIRAIAARAERVAFQGLALAKRCRDLQTRFDQRVVANMWRAVAHSRIQKGELSAAMLVMILKLPDNRILLYDTAWQVIAKQNFPLKLYLPIKRQLLYLRPMHRQRHVWRHGIDAGVDTTVPVYPAVDIPSLVGVLDEDTVNVLVPNIVPVSKYSVD